MTDIRTPFFAVTEKKLVVMSLATAGFYSLYWFYKQWQHVKAAENSNIIPGLRMIFSLIFCVPLFKKIADAEKTAYPDKKRIPAGWLAAGWIILSLMANMPWPLWLLGCLSVFFEVPVQRAANAVNAKTSPGSDPNGDFTGLNIAWIIAGAALYALMIYGSLT